MQYATKKEQSSVTEGNDVKLTTDELEVGQIYKPTGNGGICLPYHCPVIFKGETIDPPDRNVHGVSIWLGGSCYVQGFYSEGATKRCALSGECDAVKITI